MDDLIEALQVLRKYSDAHYPTTCEHDVLYVPVVDYDEVAPDDLTRLQELGFVYNSDGGMGFMSFRFGSC